MSSHSFQQTDLGRPEKVRSEVLDARQLDVAVAPIRGGRAARIHGAILRRLLAASDWVALVIGTAISAWIIGETEPTAILWSVAFGPAWILTMKLHGLYDLDHRRIRHSTLDELPPLFSSVVIGTVVVGVLAAITPAPNLSEAAMLVLAGAAFLAETSLRSALRHVWHTRRPPEKSAIVGSGTAMRRLGRRLETHPEVHLSVVGYFGAPPVTASGRGVGNGSGEGAIANASFPYLGEPSEIIAVAEERELVHILVSEESLTTDQLRHLIGECKRFGLSLTVVPPHAELLGPGIQLNRLGELPLLDFGFSDPPRSTELLKRMIDMVVAAVMLTLLSPLLLVIALAIKLNSSGPVFFKQVRIGKGGRPFTMVKFRTMVTDAGSRLNEVVDTSALPEPSFKVPNDPRNTSIGRRLRRLSLDELPQLVNVLRGDMSLVGPRPEEEAVVALYDERQRVRLSVKPGLTGPMQVYGRGDLSFEERLALERAYIDNLSIAQDVAILLRTPRAVIGGNGAY